MEQLRKLLTSLTIRQRIMIVTMAVLAAAALYGVVHWRKEGDFKPLFTGLAPEDAGAVVQKLKESGVEYRLGEGGGTVLAPSARVSEMRLALAAAGLPKSGRVGFELFDKNNFGATEFTEQVNYRRALEGELERSVMSLAEVEQARVHLTFAKDSVFLESRQPAKGSVVVRLHPGAALKQENVVAISNLVASAVEGLAPEAVAIVDTRGHLLNRVRRASADGGVAPPDELEEYRHSLENALLAKIGTTLDPLLGPEKYRAVVSVDCDASSGEQSDEVFDPTKSVMATSQRMDDGSSTPQAGGVPGTASNLPNPPAQVQLASAGLSRHTEEITYQTSRSVRHVRTPQGAIKRMSVAILLDQDVKFEGLGAGARRVLIPPSPEKLKSIHDVIAGMMGFSAERGDQLVVETLPFEQTLNVEPPPAPAPPPGAGNPKASPQSMWIEQLRTNRIWQIGAGVAVLLVLFVLAGLRMFLRKGLQKRAAVTVAAALPSPEEMESIESGEKRAELPKSAAVAALEGVVKVKPAISQRSELLAKSLCDAVTQNAEVPVQVLRSWIREEEL